jgi:hypothetical protein
LSLIAKQENANRKAIGQLSFQEAQSNLEEAQIPPIFAIDQVTVPGSDGPRSGGHAPQVQHRDRQGQA